MNMKMTGTWLLLLTFALSCDAIAAGSWLDLNRNGVMDVYEDPSQPMDRRVEDLLRRMTLAEKLGQLHMGLIRDTNSADAARQGEVGAFLAYNSPDDYAVTGRHLQQLAMNQSRLGIPLIFGFDAIHGCRTIFPIPLAMSCSWEPRLVEKVQAASAMECRELGIDWTFCPMVDLSRDPRWGRISEGFGEDPYLDSQLSAAAVRGFQGNAARPGVVACLKHYVGYGAVEGGREYNKAEITRYTLWNDYLPAFKSGIDAGALTVMSAFNCNGGTPASANSYTLRTILRDRWHFGGFVVSDYGSVVGDQGLINHGLAGDDQTAAEMAFNAGVDMEMVSTAYWTLTNDVAAGKISMSPIDDAVRRILKVKFERGLFDHAPVPPAKPGDWPRHPELAPLAREIGAKSCVLLKNDHDLLPLDKNVHCLALIGPMVQSKVDPLGCWCHFGSTQQVVTVEDGIRRTLPASTRLLVAPGCDFASTNRGGFSRALDIARQADVIVLAVGEPAIWSGEGHSRSSLGLGGVQQDLFDQIAALGKPVVVLLCNGRPLAIPDIQRKAGAILETWFLGVQSGNAIADILFGLTNPSGKLTTTFPQSVGQVPIYYDHLAVGRGYVDGPDTPVYPFGYGLSYTSFKYGPVELSARDVKVGQTMTAATTVTNTGHRAGEEIVELYVRELAASAGARPVRELRGFQRIHLLPGESREMTFDLTGKQLGYYDENGHWRVEPGRYDVWIAPDSASGSAAPFQLEKP